MISKIINTEGTQWHPAIPGEWSYPNEIHVWRSCLDLTIVEIESLVALLSDDEVLRAGRFHFERDRKRFIAARGILRQILGHYLGKRPHELRFDYTTYGKPVLAVDAGYDTLSFNLSHSDTFALFAVTRGQSIGIDIERVRHEVAIEQISQRFFSPGEINMLNKVDNEKQHELFFQYWTRKEAFIKALGAGISFQLEACDVSLMSDNFFSPITLTGEKTESTIWYGKDLFPGNGYAAAIAVEGCDCEISCRHYSV